jgi:hypothetical protein
MVKWATVSDEMKDIAFHEAGHAVVGLSLACLIEEIWVDDDEGRVQFFRGIGPFPSSRILELCSSWPVDAVPSMRDSIQRELMVHVAGLVAEDLWFGLWNYGGWPEPGTSAGCFTRLSDLLAHGATSADPDSDLNSATRAGRVLTRLDLYGDHILEAEQRADALLRREWNRVGRLARSLCRRRSHRLTGSEVERLIGSPALWQPSL